MNKTTTSSDKQGYIESSTNISTQNTVEPATYEDYELITSEDKKYYKSAQVKAEKIIIKLTQ